MLVLTRSSNKSSGNSGQAKKPFRPVRVCSLGHRGHSDDYFCLQLQQRMEESEKKLKSLSEAATPKKDSSLITTTVSVPSYYDKAILVGSASLDQITLDSAASSSIFGDRKLLLNISAFHPFEIGVASKDGSIIAHHQGRFQTHTLVIPDVIYSPDLKVNLISAGSTYDAGYDIRWGRLSAQVINAAGNSVLTFHQDPSNVRLWQALQNMPCYPRQN